MTTALPCTSRGGSDAERPRVLAPPPLIYGAALGLGFAIEAAAPTAALPDLPRRLLGWSLVAGGATLAASFVRAFLRARTSIDFHTATTLVTTGVYRLSRNPGYVGMALAYSGVAVLTGTWWAFATLVPALVAIDRCVVAGEERHLRAVFGEAYDAYTRRTRRWL